MKDNGNVNPLEVGDMQVKRRSTAVEMLFSLNFLNILDTSRADVKPILTTQAQSLLTQALIWFVTTPPTATIFGQY